MTSTPAIPRSCRAFSLIELLVVVAIVALAVVAVVTSQGLARAAAALVDPRLRRPQ
jgi:prepilin-type N-terminal cleavage/methylation domain-containing protein